MVMLMRRNRSLILFVIPILLLRPFAVSVDISFSYADTKNKPRIIVLSDIGNEPDDQASFVRLLTYSNEFDIEGLVATTSIWRRDSIGPELMEKAITAYGGSPRENLMKHTGEYFPTADELCHLVKRGLPRLGMKGVGRDQDSEGSRWITSVIDRHDPRPVWILVWGGSNCLAQTLWKLRGSRTGQDLDSFVAKIRVYAITDQDDSGKWLRKTFPKLFYIVSPGSTNRLLALLDMRNSTWSGISGENFYHFEGKRGPRSDLVSNEWLKKNIMENHGPLGAVYPEPKYIMEGDTPSFLNLINNGLRSDESPSFGGWGGRYVVYKPEGENRPVYTDTKDMVTVGDACGNVSGNREGTYATRQATVWRWREAYQNDFAARMDWASTPEYGKANHPPVVKVAGRLDRNVKGDLTVMLNAQESSDPDGDRLSYCWFQYKEAGSYKGKIQIGNPCSPQTTVSFYNPKHSGTAHIILQVKDSGYPALYRYARIIIHVEGI
jgi:hypothetical protein